MLEFDKAELLLGSLELILDEGENFMFIIPLFKVFPVLLNFIIEKSLLNDRPLGIMQADLNCYMFNSPLKFSGISGKKGDIFSQDL